MCFAPQRRAIFGHVNFKKWPESVVFSTFWLTNMLRATAACNFWTSERPKCLRRWGVFYILTRKYASRHSGVQFLNSAELPKWLRPWGVFYILTYKYASRHSRVAFWNIWTSKMAPRMWCFQHFDLQMCFAPQRRAISSPVGQNSYLRTRRFSEATFRTSGTTTHWKNTAIRDVSNIWRACWTPFITDSTRMLIFLLLSLCACWSSCYWLYTHVDLLATDSTHMLIFLLLTWLLCDSAFQLYILSEVRLLNFLRLIIVLINLISGFQRWRERVFWLAVWAVFGSCLDGVWVFLHLGKSRWCLHTLGMCSVAPKIVFGMSSNLAGVSVFSNLTLTRLWAAIVRNPRFERFFCLAEARLLLAFGCFGGTEALFFMGSKGDVKHSVCVFFAWHGLESCWCFGLFESDAEETLSSHRSESTFRTVFFAWQRLDCCWRSGVSEPKLCFLWVPKVTWSILSACFLLGMGSNLAGVSVFSNLTLTRLWAAIVRNPRRSGVPEPGSKLCFSVFLYF